MIRHPKGLESIVRWRHRFAAVSVVLGFSEVSQSTEVGRDCGSFDKVPDFIDRQIENVLSIIKDALVRKMLPDRSQHTP